MEEFEKRRRYDEQNLFMLVQVAFPIAKPLCHGSYILGTDGEHTLVKFKYERLPIFCHFFGL